MEPKWQKLWKGQKNFRCNNCLCFEIEIGTKEIAKRIRGTFNGETNFVKSYVELGKDKNSMLHKLKKSLEKEINAEIKKLNLFFNKKCFPNMKDVKEHILKQYGDQFVT